MFRTTVGGYDKKLPRYIKKFKHHLSDIDTDVVKTAYCLEADTVTNFGDTHNINAQEEVNIGDITHKFFSVHGKFISESIHQINN